MKYLVGLRKWTIMILLVLIATGFVINGNLTGTEWVNLLTATSVAFFSANLGASIVNYMKEKNDK